MHRLHPVKRRPKSRQLILPPGHTGSTLTHGGCCRYHPARMRFPVYILISVSLLSQVGMSAAYAQQREGDHILLDNGHVLIGKLIDEGEQVLVRLGPGSQMRLPRGRVRGVGHDMHALYVLQRRQLHGSNLDGHIELARWCLRNQQTRDASDLLSELSRRAPRDPQITHLQLQLRQALQPAPIAAPRLLPPTVVSKEPPSRQLADGLSRAQLNEFTSRVQPVLLNHCSAAGCHGVVAKSEYKVLRPFSGQALTQRMTSRNLAASLEYIDLNDLPRSPLLLAATELHGDRDAPILNGPRDVNSLRALTDWVSSFAATASPSSDVMTVDVQHSNALQRLTPDGTPDNSHLDAHAPTELPPVRTVDHVVEPPAEHAPSLGDPYDPSGFNRHFFPERMKERHPFDVRPDDSSPQLSEPSRLNTPPANASRNARLLDNTPGNSRILSGESQ